MKKFSLAAMALLAALLLAIPAQAAFVDMFKSMTGRTSNDANLSADNYNPKVAGSLAAYKGKKIHLGAFTNEADNTKQFSYPAEDQRLYYVVGHGSVDAYFWYAFQKALRSAGMTVYSEAAGAEVPTLKLALTYLTDHQCKARVTLIKNGEVSSVEVNAEFVPQNTEDREVLAQEAYKMMDQVVMAVMNDPGVKKVFLGGRN